MKNAFIIAILATVGVAAQSTASAKTTKKTSSTKAGALAATAAPQPLTIPKDAVLQPNGTYFWTDKQGTKWRYVKTPFGVMRGEITPAPATAPDTASNGAPVTGIRAIDEGDKVRFETPTPFGIVKREKNKSELTDAERKLYDSQNPAPAAKQD